MSTGTRGILIALLLLGLSAISAQATVHTVNQIGLTFVPDDLTISVGDTVEWNWADGFHTVTNGTDLADPDLGTMFDELLDSGNTLVSFTFNSPGEVPYLCRLHVALGMTGIIRVTTGVTHTVDQVNLTFVPDDITINVGDTVEWIWSGGIHTVTNGLSLVDPDLGTLFDSPLDSENTSFSFTFFSAGDVPYLCRPHFNFGMIGIVRVQSTTPVEEVPGQVGFALHQNTPNPFNPRTVIRYTLPEPASVSLRIYDVSGRLVQVILDRNTVEAGSHEAVWNGRNEMGRNQPAGVYFYHLDAGSYSMVKRMTLVK